MRVLIVGCGYIGLALGKELRKQGHQVFGLRRSRSAEAEMRAAGIEPLSGNISEATELATLPPAYDWVVDCVSAGGGGVEAYRSTYLQGMQNLIAWLLPAKPDRFIYTSSTSVYGQNDGSVVEENSPTKPRSETAKVLVATENELLGAAREKEFPGIILRLAGIYGPGRGYWLKQFASGEARLDGDGQRILNMVHRDDVVGAIIAAFERAQPGAIYNVVDDEPVTQRTFFEWLSDCSGRPLPPTGETNLPSKRGGGNKRVSNHKLKRELQYTFRFPTFREGCTQPAC